MWTLCRVAYVGQDFGTQEDHAEVEAACPQHLLDSKLSLEPLRLSLEPGSLSLELGRRLRLSSRLFERRVQIERRVQKMSPEVHSSPRVRSCPLVFLMEQCQTVLALLRYATFLEFHVWAAERLDRCASERGGVT